MNILILNGSPRLHGNTHYVLDVIKQNLEKDNNVEFIDVSSLKIDPCSACCACEKNGNICVCKDQSNEINQKIIEADAIIFGTPVYWWGMSAQLKVLIDKFYSKTFIFKTYNKKIGIVTVGAAQVSDPQYKLINDQFACIAKYLNWKIDFALSFSGSAPDDVMKQPEVPEILKKACADISK